VRKAEVRISPGLSESMLVHRALTGKNSLIAIHVIRGTKLSIGGARIAAGDAVTAIGPGPAHRVALRDIDLARIERESRPDLHIKNLAARRSHAAHRWPAVLVHNVDCVGGRLSLLPLRGKRQHKRRYQPTSKPYRCLCL
jgi:hypothetical protein